MKLATTILAIYSAFMSLNAAADDTISWASTKADITAEGLLTIEIQAKIHLDAPEGAVSFFIQDGEKPLGNPKDANVTIAKGDSTKTLKRAVTIPQNLTELTIFTPLYVGEKRTTNNVKVGEVKISWTNRKTPTVKVKPLD